MTAMKKKNNTTLMILLAIIILGVIGVLESVLTRRPHTTSLAAVKIDGTMLPAPKSIGNFTLASSAGGSFTQKDLLGHWTMLFFGYTSCNYICPTTMAEMAKFYTAVQATVPKSEWPQVVFVSVDPKRDSLKRIHDYVGSFNNAFIGLRGTDAEVHTLADNMNVTFDVIPMGGPNDYGMSHSSAVMLINPKGQWVALFSFPHKGVVMAQDYQKILGNYSR